MKIILDLKEKVNKALAELYKKVFPPKIRLECRTCGEKKVVTTSDFFSFANDGCDNSIFCSYCGKSTFKKNEIKRKSFKIKIPKFIESFVNIVIIFSAIVFAEIYKVLARFLQEDFYLLLSQSVYFLLFCASAIIIKQIFNLSDEYSIVVGFVFFAFLFLNKIFHKSRG